MYDACQNVYLKHIKKSNKENELRQSKGSCVTHEENPRKFQSSLTEYSDQNAELTECLKELTPFRIRGILYPDMRLREIIKRLYRGIYFLILCVSHIPKDFLHRPDIRTLGNNEEV